MQPLPTPSPVSCPAPCPATRSLVELRQSIARLEGETRRYNQTAPDQAARVPLGPAEADRALGGGLRRGALHEIFAARAADGPAASGFVAALACRLAGRSGRILWIREDFCDLEWGRLHAPGLVELGLDPDRLVLVRVAHAADGLKAASDALACSGLNVLVLESAAGAGLFDLTASRRLALAAAHSGATALVLRLSAEPEPSSAETRWVVTAAASASGLAGHLGRPAFEAALIRNRKGLTGQWTMEWNSDASHFASHLRTSRRLASLDGQFETGPAHAGAVAAEAHGRAHGRIVPLPGIVRRTG